MTTGDEGPAPAGPEPDPSPNQLITERRRILAERMEAAAAVASDETRSIEDRRFASAYQDWILEEIGFLLALMRDMLDESDRTLAPRH